jgi:hypothetical protein
MRNRMGKCKNIKSKMKEYNGEPVGSVSLQPDKDYKL